MNKTGRNGLKKKKKMQKNTRSLRVSRTVLHKRNTFVPRINYFNTYNVRVRTFFCNFPSFP